MRRTALLQTPGEPCTVAYWLRNFQTWRDEVDDFIVLVNNLYYPNAKEFDQRAITDAGGEVIFVDGRVQHGDCINRLLEKAHDKDPDGLVVLVEDDAYVRTPGSVRAAFDRIEQGQTDVIGSPRYQDRPEDRIEGEWGPPTQDWSEIGRVLWPTFLFARSADLLATDRQFGYRTWNVGERLPGLDIEVTPELCAYINTGSYAALDVFYSTSHQLRAAGLRIEHVNRVRMWKPDATEQWVRENPPWCHATELSTMLGAVMPIAPGVAPYPKNELPDLQPGGGRWTRCVAWWERIGRNPPPLPGWGEMYHGWLERFAETADIDHAEVARWQQRIDPWITWAEA